MMQRRFVSRMNAKAAAVLLLVLLVSHASSAECREVRGSGGRRLDFEIRSRGGAGKVSLDVCPPSFCGGGSQGDNCWCCELLGSCSYGSLQDCLANCPSSP
ncbi:uncharacterized protein LOC123401264 [Hordeum vulgare subsp. vulgare]|uniref:uncharacterized protein LOC123401264 n=1 Tax=Hordeum vulgare subsp. vulgare TaxID=112509 RepID=UPI001D1A42DD|nr:uncharacterized protein LOC123401264 [Hordeum vulgare subsp. vulgare]